MFNLQLILLAFSGSIRQLNFLKNIELFEVSLRVTVTPLGLIGQFVTCFGQK